MQNVPTRSLVVRTPWIELILAGEKTWELRTKPTSVRGRVGLIRAGSGLIVGETRLVDIVGPLDETALRSTRHLHRAEDVDAALGSGWIFGWVLEEVRAYRSPIPYSHPVGAVVWVRTAADRQTASAERR